MAQPNSQENAGSPNFGLHINKKIKKITKSREFGHVKESLKALNTQKKWHTPPTLTTNLAGGDGGDGGDGGGGEMAAGRIYGQNLEASGNCQ